MFLPREGVFVGAVKNLGRKLLLVDFGTTGEEYLFPNEVLDETANVDFAISHDSQAHRAYSC